MIDRRKQQIIDFVKTKGQCSSKEIFDGIGESFSYATLKRVLTDLKAEDYLLTKGHGKGTKYLLSPAYELIRPIDIEKYYEKEIDERQIIGKFNSELITGTIKNYNSFTDSELDKLALLQKEYKKTYRNYQKLNIRGS